GCEMEQDTAPALPPAFGDLLKHYRLAAGLTQEALAQRARLSARAVTDLERGVNRTPRRHTLRLLEEALRLSDLERARLAAAAGRDEASAPGIARREPRALPSTVPTGARPPLIGRAAELRALDDHLGGAGPPVLLFAGEPGIGKSRLLAEAVARAAGHGLRPIPGGCQR